MTTERSNTAISDKYTDGRRATVVDKARYRSKLRRGNPGLYKYENAKKGLVRRHGLPDVEIAIGAINVEAIELANISITMATNDVLKSQTHEIEARIVSDMISKTVVLRNGSIITGLFAILLLIGDIMTKNLLISPIIGILLLISSAVFLLMAEVEK